MKRISLFIILGMALTISAVPALAQQRGGGFSAQVDQAVGGLNYHALVIGINAYAQAPLRYCVKDATLVAETLRTRCGYDADHVFLMTDGLKNFQDIPTADNIQRTARLMARMAGEQDTLLVYFSGHANEMGLLLGDEVYSYRSLRNWMDLLEADVRIAVLDACASGAITRLKGSRRRKAFLVDASSDMRGHAFLTSSSADEVAQESDRIGGSFFTHYLVSGLRGAADVSGEGMVTLNEAYQFAFNETLGRTAETQAGAQHRSSKCDQI